MSLEQQIEKEIVANFHKSRKILDAVFWGNPIQRRLFNAELNKNHAESMAELRKDHGNNWPDDSVNFLYWITPDDIIKTHENINQ